MKKEFFKEWKQARAERRSLETQERSAQRNLDFLLHAACFPAHLHMDFLRPAPLHVALGGGGGVFPVFIFANGLCSYAKPVTLVYSFWASLSTLPQPRMYPI